MTLYADRTFTSFREEGVPYGSNKLARIQLGGGPCEWLYCAGSTQVGDTLEVFHAGQATLGTVIETTHVTRNFRRRYARIPEDGRRRKEPAETDLCTTTQQKEEEVMELVIERKVFVNGRDLASMDNDYILALLQGAQDEIAKLSKLDPIPKRFQAEIDKLMAARKELIAILDEQEEPA